MAYRFADRTDSRTIPIVPIETAVFAAWLRTQPAALRRWVESTGFSAAPGAMSLVAGADGGLEKVLLGTEAHDGLWSYAGLPDWLPPGKYRIDAVLEKEAATGAALGWALACYHFGRYRKAGDRKFPTLVWPRNCDRAAVGRAAAATHMVRDLINIPADHMGPAELAAAVEALQTQGIRVEIEP